MSLVFKEPPKNIFSANEIRQYGECPRKRYYASRDCLAIRSSTPSSNLSLGKTVHAMLEHYYTKLNDLIIANEISVITEDLFNYVDDFILEPDLLSIDDTKIFECIKTYYKPQIIEDLKKFQVVGCEHNFTLHDWPFEGVMYHGEIDMIVLDVETNTLYFVEHKTCKDFRPEIYNRFDIQLHVYDNYGRKYCKSMGYEWGGIILNEIKKAKTDRGFANHRMTYLYSEKEVNDFYNWICRKTLGAVSHDNMHEPCNNYMTCKMCEYSDICLKYGYEVPQTTQEITEVFKDDEGNLKFIYDPRESLGEEE